MLASALEIQLKLYKPAELKTQQVFFWEIINMDFTSDILHSNRKGKVRHGSVHKPVHHSVSFSFDDARELAYVFQGKKSGYSCGRQVNPTVSAL